VNYKPTVQHN